MKLEELNHHRMSDRILFALDMALKQEDVDIAEKLAHALDLSMTRNTGGGEFIERREYPEQIEDALNRFDELKKKHSETCC